MAKLDSVTFLGRSGREHRFRVYKWKNEFRPLPAVYIVTERVVEPGKASMYTPIFLGITDDLSRVFDNHPKSECFQMYLANTIAVLPERSLPKRLQIAKELTETLKPPCNEHDPC